MQYLSLAFSLAWPQITVAILWFIVALAALRYARATRRPVFLWGGMAALLLSLSEVLSPLRLAYRYFSHRISCPSYDACAVELQFGAAKFVWPIVGLAAVLFFVGFYLDVARARRRAAANNAARAAASRQPKAAPVPAGAYAGSYQGAPEQPITAYSETQQASADHRFSQGLVDADLATSAGDEQPPFSYQPRSDSESEPF